MKNNSAIHFVEPEIGGGNKWLAPRRVPYVPDYAFVQKGLDPGIVSFIVREALVLGGFEGGIIDWHRRLSAFLWLFIL